MSFPNQSTNSHWLIRLYAARARLARWAKNVTHFAEDKALRSAGCGQQERDPSWSKNMYHCSLLQPVGFHFHLCWALPSLSKNIYHCSLLQPVGFHFHLCWALPSLSKNMYHCSLLQPVGFHFHLCWALPSLLKTCTIVVFCSLSASTFTCAGHYHLCSLFANETAKIVVS